ncbi:hypothetical protein [Rubellicoccus peritrichatus]|uniref:Uncharacterized protein n=1 Tax=Rubellicoccus peritrichatus TaxID=3080537 RepID=A0AAQ3LAQ0_9BACT|nr:hypothetical protein [Puniceicoccus sp. CR14]WOO40747.1 hypothetical protein RZN69_19160 [Puniceicoccus sp. CR14]
MNLHIDVVNEETWVTGSDTGRLDINGRIYWTFQPTSQGLNLPSGTLDFASIIVEDAPDGAFFFANAAVAELGTNSGDKYGAFGVEEFVGVASLATVTIVGTGSIGKFSYSGLRDKSYFEAMIGQSVPFFDRNGAADWSNLNVVVPEPAHTALLIVFTALFACFRRKRP